VLASGPAATSAPTVQSVTVTVAASSYGRILFDGRGFALYAFGRDPRGHSSCGGDCAKAWPPYLAHGAALRPGRGASSALLATTTRANGSRQVTYAGRPLYYYVGDRRPREILCQNVTEFGGVWLVVRASGALVR